jgi:hypothetical protein
MLGRGALPRCWEHLVGARAPQGEVAKWPCYSRLRTKRTDMEEREVDRLTAAHHHRQRTHRPDDLIEASQQATIPGASRSSWPT